ncbi:MAG: ECF-type sigma factor [Planctomycetota bacterium]
MPDSAEDVTSLLSAVSEGDHSAWDRLIAAVYQELYTLARTAMSKERHRHTLQATALVNELYLRLARKQGFHWENRSHFFHAAAIAMQRILVSEARRRKAAKRGGGQPRADFDTATEPVSRTLDHDHYLRHLEVLDSALKRFSAIEDHKRMCRVLDLHLFANRTLEETASELGVSKGTVKNDWAYTKAWLLREMGRIERDGQ